MLINQLTMCYSCGCQLTAYQITTLVKEFSTAHTICPSSLIPKLLL